MKKLDIYISSVLFILLSICYTADIQAQQDPQFTHYMYNTMSVNPGYTGSKGHGVITAIGRTQWLGFDGAPDSQTLSYHTPLTNEAVGLGFNVINDKLGPGSEIYFDANGSYTVATSTNGKLGFGLKLGGRLLDLDWSKGNNESQNDPSFLNNVRNKFLPTVGVGLYYYTQKGYVGLSVPNFLLTEHYKADNNQINVADERMHFYLIGGYVFDLTDNIKFKPATLFKGVQGATLIGDVSGNFLFNEKFTAGLAWRWSDSFSGLIGFQANPNFYIGYGYDLTNPKYRVTNSGTHEIMLRYEFLKKMVAFKSPRFF